MTNEARIITITLPDMTDVLVRIHTDQEWIDAGQEVEVDIRGGEYGSVWTPVRLHGGAFAWED